MIGRRVAFGVAVAIVANGLLLLVFSHGWSLAEPGVDRDFGWGFTWLGSAITATLLGVPSGFLVGRWQRLVSWWTPSLVFVGLATALAVAAVGTTLLMFWILSTCVAR